MSVWYQGKTCQGLWVSLWNNMILLKGKGYLWSKTRIPSNGMRVPSPTRPYFEKQVNLKGRR